MIQFRLNHFKRYLLHKSYIDQGLLQKDGFEVIQAFGITKVFREKGDFTCLMPQRIVYGWISGGFLALVCGGSRQIGFPRVDGKRCGFVGH